MADRIKNVKRNVAWGVLNSAISIIVPFITRTVIIYTIGIEYTGLNSLFNSILQALSLAELGIGSALVFSMYKPMADNDVEQVCALLNFYRTCYRITGIVVLILGIIILPFIDILVAGDIPGDVNIRILFIIYIVNNVIGYLCFAYKTSLFSARQRVDVSVRINILIQFLKMTAQIAAIIVCHNYYVFVVVLPVTTLINNMITGYIAKKKFPEYKCEGKLNYKQLKEIGSKVGGLIFQKIGNIVFTASDTIIISAFLGLKILGIYNGYYYIIMSLQSIFVMLDKSLIPSVGNSIVKDDKKKNYADFKKFHFIYIWILSWMCACLLCLYQPFIKLWQGEESMFSINMVVLFVIYFFICFMGEMTHVYREAIGLWWEGKFIPLLASILNLILNLIMVKRFGIPGVLLSTIISSAFISVPYTAFIVFKYYFNSVNMWFEYLRKLIDYFIIASIISIITYFITSFIQGYGILSILLIALICITIPNLLLFIIYHRNEDFINGINFLYSMLPGSIKRFVVIILKKEI